MTSQLKKAERAEAQALEKDQKDKAKRYSQRITSGKFLKKPRAVMLVETKKRKSMKMGDIASAEEEDDPDDIPEGFHLQEGKPPLHQYDQGGGLPGLLAADCTGIRAVN